MEIGPLTRCRQLSGATQYDRPVGGTDAAIPVVELPDPAAPSAMGWRCGIPQWFVAVLRALPWLLAGAGITIVGFVEARGHWLPTGDNAMITSFSLDLFDHPPLLGMPTSLSNRTGVPVRHPGPLPFWLIGGPARAFGAPGHGVLLASVGIHLGSVALAAFAAWSLRPRLVAPLTGTLCGGLILWSLSNGSVAQPFNPLLAVLSAFASLLGAWAVVSGRTERLWVFVLAGSVAGQAHVTFLPLIAVVSLLVVVAVALHLRRASMADRRRTLLRSVLPAVLAGLLCWSGPIIDQLFGHGNLFALARGTGGGPSAGWRYGLARVVDVSSFRPLWTTVPPGGPLPDPSAQRWAVAGLVLGFVALGAVLGFRRRNRMFVGGCAVAFTALAGAALVSSLVPADPAALASPNNRLFWWPVGCVLWAVVAAMASELARPLLSALPAASRQPIVLMALAMAVVLSGMAFVQQIDVDPKQMHGSIIYGAVLQHSMAIDAATPEGGTVRIEAPDTTIDNYTFVQSLIAQLRLRGLRVQVEVVDLWGYFTAYKAVHPTEGEPDTTVFVQGTRRSPGPPAEYELLSQYDPTRPPPNFIGYQTPVVFGGGRDISRIFVRR